MAARSVCLKLATRSTTTTTTTTTTRAFTYLPLRALHSSTCLRASAATPPSKAANMAEDPVTHAPPPKKGGVVERLTAAVREFMPNTTDQYVAYGVTQELYNECVNQAAYVEGQEMSESAKFWYEVCKRDPTFAAWAQVTVLHMWLLIVRIRAFPPDRVQNWQQHFVDHFFYDSESKMIQTYKLTSAQTRKKYLKDLYEQYRGTIASFDEGMCKGDAVLAAAVWRNVFDARDDVDPELLAMVVAYMRRVLSGLDKVADETMYRGRIEFGMPLDEEPVVAQKSRFLERLEKEKGEVGNGEVDGARVDPRLNVE